MTYGFVNYKPFHSEKLHSITQKIKFKIWSCEYKNYESEESKSTEEILEIVIGKLDPVPRITWVFYELDQWVKDNYIQPSINNEEERIKLWTYICLEYIKIKFDRIENESSRIKIDYKPYDFGFTDEVMDRIHKWLDRNLQK